MQIIIKRKPAENIYRIYYDYEKGLVDFNLGVKEMERLYLELGAILRHEKDSAFYQSHPELLERLSDCPDKAEIQIKINQLVEKFNEMVNEFKEY